MDIPWDAPVDVPQSDGSTWRFETAQALATAAAAHVLATCDRILTPHEVARQAIQAIREAFDFVPGTSLGFEVRGG